jgi:hypothetical protein
MAPLRYEYFPWKRVAKFHVALFLGKSAAEAECSCELRLQMSKDKALWVG